MAKKKILIVDDEVGFTNLVRLNLEETGNYEVKEENEGVHVLMVLAGCIQELPQLFGVEHVLVIEGLRSIDA